MSRLQPSVDPLEIRVAELEIRVASLEAARQPRDAEDVAVLLKIAETVNGLPFTAGRIQARASIDPELRTVLNEAGLDTPVLLGYWLRDMSRRELGSVRVVRVRRTGGGYLWRIEIRADV